MKNDATMNHSLEDLLRRCVGCGLCLPHCATWAVTGNEVHSPRGRLLLLDDLLKDPDAETRSAYADAFDTCIGCRACETACPSGVPFSLLEHGQHLVAAETARPSRVLSFLNRHLDSPGSLNFLRVAGRTARMLLRGIGGPNWRRRMDKAPLGAANLVRMLGSMPSAPHSNNDLIEQLDRLLGTRSVDLALNFNEVPKTRDIAFFVGCANEGLMPSSTKRLVDLLNLTGHRIHFLENQQCCGALAAHTGRPGKAARLQHANRQSMNALENREIPILVEAAGCGLQLKEYGDDVACRVIDATVLLASLPLPQMREVSLKVVYHDPCHARHGQGIFEEPRIILQQIPGLKLVEALESEVCCGSGGVWGLTHPDLSQQLGRRKARNLSLSGAQLSVTSNVGCLGQIADAMAVEISGLPILPLTDLLWFALFTKSGKK